MRPCLSDRSRAFANGCRSYARRESAPRSCSRIRSTKIATPPSCEQSARSNNRAVLLRLLFLIAGALIARVAGQCDAIEEALDSFCVDAEVADSVARFRSHLDQAGAVGTRPNLDHDIIVEMPQL